MSEYSEHWVIRTALRHFIRLWREASGEERKRRRDTARLYLVWAKRRLRGTY